MNFFSYLVGNANECWVKKKVRGGCFNIRYMSGSAVLLTGHSMLGVGESCCTY